MVLNDGKQEGLSDRQVQLPLLNYTPKPAPGDITGDCAHIPYCCSPFGTAAGTNKCALGGNSVMNRSIQVHQAKSLQQLRIPISPRLLIHSHTAA